MNPYEDEGVSQIYSSYWELRPPILNDICSLIVSSNMSILDYSQDTQISIENEPEEIKNLINPHNIINNYIQYKDAPLALKYKINRNIANLEEKSKYVNIDEYTKNPLCACYSIYPKIRFQVLMCIQCGNYIMGNNMTKNSQCFCNENRYKSEYISNVLSLFLLYKSNISIENIQYGEIINHMESQIQKYNDWCDGLINQCPYDLVVFEYSDSEDEEYIPKSTSYISISDIDEM
jgi:hypothetical protein